jgi:hypothetical protein
MAITFTTTQIQADGKNATRISVPPEHAKVGQPCRPTFVGYSVVLLP